MGPAWVLPDPDPRMWGVRDILRTEAAAAGAAFLDPLGDGWFLGHPELIGQNGDHPNDAGHVLMAEKIAPVISQLLAGVQPPPPTTFVTQPKP
ncbi:hypothetical protein [Mycolicibacterium baixiangningiae]|uniref:hypothetical protein n=1 Tax=Mycolicibacterium baixiangningiae TaxID=2761578 RepID=UPI0018D08B4E|nr:hypothetical protein [Mycolicibacterium baixiangningiae]